MMNGSSERSLLGRLCCVVLALGGPTAWAGKLYRTPERDPLPAKVRLVDDSGALDMYQSCEDLQNDLTQALRLIASNAIIDTYQRGYYRAPGVGTRAGYSRDCEDSFWSDDDLIFQPLLPDEPDETEDGDNDDTEDQSMRDNNDNRNNDGGDETEGVDDFETNNQVEGVDEADILKSDGTYVYAAYGNEIVIWDPQTGKEVERKRMRIPSRISGRPRNVDRHCYKKKNGRGGGEEPQPWWWDPNRHDPHSTIKSLLLHEDRLVAVVETDRGCQCEHRNAARREQFILTDARYSLELMIFETTPLQRGGKLRLVGKRDLGGGRYIDARSIGSTVHVVSSTTPNLKEQLTDQFFRHGDAFRGAREGPQYIQRATRVANQLIRTLSADMVSELVNLTRSDARDDNNMCSGVSKIVLYATTGGHALSEGTEEFIRSSGLLQSLTLVTSINIGPERLRPRQRVPAGNTAIFLPENPESNVYASEDVLILSARGWRRKDRNWKWTETTYLTALALSNNQDDEPATGATPKSVGFVPGRLVNQFALDHYGNHLRVATTIRAQFGCVEFRNDNPNRECLDWGQIRGTRNQLYVLEFPSTTMTTDAPSKSSKIMPQVGLLTGLGKPNELIFAVRFVGEVAYVVTFERTDPFYILDLSDPENPRATGELEISGFSNYLHPVTGDNGHQFVLAVGEDADDRGRSLGVQISLFDVTDTTNPTLAYRHVVEDQKSLWSFSDAQWEHKAFRYVKDLQAAILPVSFRGGGRRRFYDGFYVYKVSLGDDEEDGEARIDYLFDVEHAEDQDRCFSPTASLSSRSMVFDSNIMSVKRHSVKSVTLTGEEVWVLDLDKDIANKGRNTRHCGDWW